MKKPALVSRGLFQCVDEGPKYQAGQGNDACPSRGAEGRRGGAGGLRFRFELVAVLLDEVQVIVLPGVEVLLVEVQVHAHQRAEHAVLAPQPLDAVAPDLEVPQQAVALEHVDQALGGVEGEEEGALDHRPAAQPGLAVDQHEHVVGHRLVLGFLQCVPAPQAGHGRVGAFQPPGVAQQAVGHDRGEVLQGRGGRQLPRRVQFLLGEADAPFGAAFQAVDVVAEGAQAVAVDQVLAAVVAFLADEATDLLLQRRVLDPFAVVAHGVDEEALAIGEQHRHGVEHVGLESVAAVPMARHRIGQVEVQMTRADLQTFGGGAGHSGSL